MATEAPTKPPPANPCCAAWRNECEKMKRMRRAYKETVDVLKNALEKAQGEISNLKKKQQEEVVKVDVERETKEKEEAVRALEKNVSDLKVELSSLQKRLEQNLQEKNEGMMLLQGQVSEGEKEINQLKDLLQKEKLRADNAEERRKEVCEKLKKTKSLKVKTEKKNDTDDVLKRLLENEKRATEVERKKAESEKKKADQYYSELEVLRTNADKAASELEVLRTNADKATSELVALRTSFETVSKQLNLEKQKRLKEKKCADMEIAKAKEQKKLVEDLSKQLETAKASNEEFRKKMELEIASNDAKNAEYSAKLEEQFKHLKMNEKVAMDWKSRAENLAQELKEARLVSEDLQKNLEELSASQKLAENRSISPQKVRHLESAELEILRKELKFERKRVKHAKQLTKLEKVRREVLVDELSRLKLDFTRFSNRLNLLDDYFSSDMEGTDDHGKAKDHKKLLRLKELSQVNLISENKICGTRCNVVARSGCQEQARQFAGPIISNSRQHLCESVTGTISESKSLIGGSKKFQTSGENSSTSFSDGQFAASQERGRFTVSTSAKIAKDNMDIQPPKANMSPRVSDARNNENLCLVAESHLQSHQTDISDIVNKHLSERKRMAEAVESLKNLYSEDRKLNSRIGEKVMTLHSMLVGNMVRPFKGEESLLPYVQDDPCINCGTVSKKRRAPCEINTMIQCSDESRQSKRIKLSDAKTCEDLVTSGKTPQQADNPTENAHASVEKICLSSANKQVATTLGFEEVDGADYMKLLELDRSEDEECYKLAREVPLSPNIPVIDVQGDEDQNPPRALDLVAGNSDDMCGNLDASMASMAVGTSTVCAKIDENDSLHDHTPQHVVVFTNIKEEESIVRVVHASNKCIQRCPPADKGELALEEILLSLKMEENLSVLERASVLLSLLLHNFSIAASMKIRKILNADALSYLDSFSMHIYRVLTDAETGAMLSELLDELIGLIQDFLLEPRILCSVTSSEMSESDSNISVCLDGENVTLSKRVASIDRVVAGSAIFAAICSATDRVGFICEASFEILYKHSHAKTSELLVILHVFVYVAGEKMLSSREHNLPITVLKSIIKFLEDRYLDSMEGEIGLHPSKKCPFSTNSPSSLEDVVIMLLEILQKFAQSSSSASDPLAEKTKFSLPHEYFQCLLGSKCDASCCLSKNQSETIGSGVLCQLCDILSMVELIAGYMAWNSTSANVVAPLLKMLEMPLAMDFSVAIISLVGQLGSIGVDACGYEEEGIKNMIDKLSAFLQCETSLKAGFAVQLATVSSLLKLLPSDCLKIVQSNTTLTDPSAVSIPGNLIAKWLSLLSDDQRAFSFEFLQIVR